MHSLKSLMQCCCCLPLKPDDAMREHWRSNRRSWSVPRGSSSLPYIYLTQNQSQHMKEDPKQRKIFEARCVRTCCTFWALARQLPWRRWVRLEVCREPSPSLSCTCCPNWTASREDACNDVAPSPFPSTHRAEIQCRWYFLYTMRRKYIGEKAHGIGGTVTFIAQATIAPSVGWPIRMPSRIWASLQTIPTWRGEDECACEWPEGTSDWHMNINVDKYLDDFWDGRMCVVAHNVAVALYTTTCAVTNSRHLSKRKHYCHAERVTMLLTCWTAENTVRENEIGRRQTEIATKTQQQLPTFVSQLSTWQSVREKLVACLS